MKRNVEPLIELSRSNYKARPSRTNSLSQSKTKITWKFEKLTKTKS